MSTVLKLTVASGDEHIVPFTTASTLTVKSRVLGPTGEVVDQQWAYSDVLYLELVDAATGDAAGEVTEDKPGFTSPAAAAFFAKGLPLADAAAHIEKAIAKFGPDPDLLTMQAELHEAVQSGAETWTTSVEPVISDEPIGEGNSDVVEWLESADAAAAHINSVETLDEAETKLTAALELFPDSEALAELKASIDGIRASQTGTK